MLDLRFIEDDSQAGQFGQGDHPGDGFVERGVEILFVRLVLDEVLHIRDDRSGLRSGQVEGRQKRMTVGDEGDVEGGAEGGDFYQLRDAAGPIGVGLDPADRAGLEQFAHLPAGIHMLAGGQGDGCRLAQAGETSQSVPAGAALPAR